MTRGSGDEVFGYSSWNSRGLLGYSCSLQKPTYRHLLHRSLLIRETGWFLLQKPSGPLTQSRACSKWPWWQGWKLHIELSNLNFLFSRLIWVLQLLCTQPINHRGQWSALYRAPFSMGNSHLPDEKLMHEILYIWRSEEYFLFVNLDTPLRYGLASQYTGCFF